MGEPILSLQKGGTKKILNSYEFLSPLNTVLQFPSRKSGMEFFTLIPVPENGNGILWNFYSRSRSRKLDWNFPLGFPFPKNGNGICHFPFPFPKSKSHSRSWLEGGWGYPPFPLTFFHSVFGNRPSVKGGEGVPNGIFP